MQTYDENLRSYLLNFFVYIYLLVHSYLYLLACFFSLLLKGVRHCGDQELRAWRRVRSGLECFSRVKGSSWLGGLVFLLFLLVFLWV